MQRTKPPITDTGNGVGLAAYAKLLGDLVGRMQLSTKVGMQYDGERDVYKALGYPDTTQLQFSDYYNRYLRQDMAKAVIDRPVRATWQGTLELIETDITKDTKFEDAWYDLSIKLKFKSKLSCLDRLTSIGRYGVLLLGFDDVKRREGFAKPVEKGERKLLYIRAFSEASAEIKEFETNPSNDRYGLPSLYEIKAMDMTTSATFNVMVHHSRVIHVTDETLESEIYGIPRLQAIYNRLLDLDKVIGGDAEMFWRGARPGYEGTVDPNYTMTEATKRDLIDQITEYENNLRRILINEGVELKALTQQIADPESHVNSILKMISAESGIPLRILIGSERGELASTQDTSEWKEFVQSRREDHAEPDIIRPLANRLIEVGVLPKPHTDNFIVKWSDLFALSEKARVDIGKARATALREYTYSAIAETILPPDSFLEVGLGLTTEQITLVHKQRDEMISKEELYDKILEDLNVDTDEPEKEPKEIDDEPDKVLEEE